MLQNKKIFALKVIFIFLISFHIINIDINKFTISYDVNIIQSDSRLHGQLYYKDTSQYNDKHVKNIKYKDIKNTFQNYTFNITNLSNISAIRFDPLPNKGIVEIKNFTIASKYHTYKVNFNNINTEKNSHHIKIIKKDSQSIILDCTGSDPYIELANDICFPYITWKKLRSFIIFSLLLYILMELLLFSNKIFSIEKILLSTILFTYTFYAVLGSDWRIAEHLLIIFSSIGILSYFQNHLKFNSNYIKQITIFLLLYLTMSYMSIFTSTELADLNYLNNKTPLIIAAALIPMSFYFLKPFNFKYFKVFLTILLMLYALFIIALNLDFISLDNIKIYDLTLRRHNWTQKNYMFWYVLLMFGTLSFYNFKNKKDFIIIILLLALSYYTVFYGYSRSAMLAYSIGILIYIVLSLFQVKKKYLQIIIWILTLYIIFSPLLFSLIDLTPYHPRLNQRDAIYHTAAALIKEHWLFGYGFGSTLTIHLQDFVSASEMPKHYRSVFPGGHPHNLSLLFWLEFGVFGALFLAYYIHKLLFMFIEKTYNQMNLPALFGMIVAFDIITSFSWSIWYPQVLLTFSFFGVMLVLSMNINIQQDKGT